MPRSEQRWATSKPDTIKIHIEERELRFAGNGQLHRFLRRAGRTDNLVPGFE
jgi:hypothetical protein